MLPRGYVELDYIEGTGTQYINTGLNTANNIEYNIKFSMDYVAATASVMGGYPFHLAHFVNKKSDVNNAMVLYVDALEHGIYSTQRYASAFTIEMKAYRAREANTSYIQINDDPKEYYPDIQGEEPTLSNIYLFTSSDYSNNPLTSILVGKIYYAKIYINNTLMRDMVPCLRMSDKTAGMYDKVNNQFYTNAGTGTFGWAFRDEEQLFQYFKAVDYIEATGTQYIDSEFLPDSSSTVEAKVKTIGGKSFTIGGQYNTNNNTTFINITGAVRPSVGLGWAKNSTSGLASMPMASAQVINSHLSSGSQTLTIQNVNTGSYTYGNSVSTFVSTYIFAKNSNGTPTYSTGGCLYYCKMWHANNTLMRDFIPVAYDGQGYLYDKVSKKIFWNKGTGVFKYNKVHATEDEIKECEWIGSNGTQFIDSDLITEPGYKSEVKIEFANVTSAYYYLGTVQASSNQMSFLYTNTYAGYYYRGTNKTTSPTAVTKNTPYEITTQLDNGSQSLVVQDVASVTYNTTGTISPLYYSMYIFARNNIGTQNICAGAKIYKLKMYDETNTLVRDYVPAVYESRPCLYDKVEEKVYFNCGTDEFIFGPMTLEPWELRYTSYLQSSGTQYTMSDTKDAPMKYKYKFAIPVAASSLSGTSFCGNSAYWRPGIQYQSDETYKLTTLYDGSAHQVPTSVVPEQNVEYIVEGQRGDLNISLNNEMKVTRASDDTVLDQYSTSTYSGTSGITIPLVNNYAIFARIDNTINQTIGGNATVRLYYLKFYDTSDHLIANYVPAYYDNVLGMYNTVTKHFFSNNGTGTFTKPADYTVELSASPDSEGHVVGSGTYLRGDTVQIKAIPISPSIFQSWTGDETSTQNPYSFTINSDKTIQALFGEVVKTFKRLFIIAK